MCVKSSLAACRVKTATVYHPAERLQCSVLHPVLVNVEIMEDLRAAGGSAGQHAFSFNSHQPLLVVDSHVAGHMLFGPGVQPGLEASVQACIDPLLGLNNRTTQISDKDIRKAQK